MTHPNDVAQQGVYIPETKMFYLLEAGPNPKSIDKLVTILHAQGAFRYELTKNTCPYEIITLKQANERGATVELKFLTAMVKKAYEAKQAVAGTTKVW